MKDRLNASALSASGPLIQPRGRLRVSQRDIVYCRILRACRMVFRMLSESGVCDSANVRSQRLPRQEEGFG